MDNHRIFIYNDVDDTPPDNVVHCRWDSNSNQQEVGQTGIDVVPIEMMVLNQCASRKSADNLMAWLSAINCSGKFKLVFSNNEYISFFCI